MFRTICAAVVLVGGVAMAVPAHADLGCSTTLCVTSGLTGVSEGCYFNTSTSRRCYYHFNYVASATSTLPGNLSWTVYAPNTTVNGGCNWLTGGCTSGSSSTSSGSDLVNCGSTKTLYADMYTDGYDALYYKPNYDKASVKLIPGC
jgi:hypothetical protein